MSAELVLRSETLIVTVLADKGADIRAVTHRASGINVLFQPPWPEGGPTPPPEPDEREEWLAHYRGGWQLLVPNAGASRLHAGARQGYHGEASLRRWNVVAADDARAQLNVTLRTAPLHIDRIVHLDADTLFVRDVLTNRSEKPVSFRWVHHAAFGAPFIDGDSTLHADAVDVVIHFRDGGVVHDHANGKPFPLAALGADEIVDLRQVPPPHSGRSLFATLGQFTTPRFTITSPRTGLQATLAWDSTHLPFAWLWQECHAEQGYPWYGQAYAVGVEPANFRPGRPADSQTDLAPWAQAITETTLRLNSSSTAA